VSKIEELDGLLYFLRHESDDPVDKNFLRTAQTLARDVEEAIEEDARDRKCMVDALERIASFFLAMNGNCRFCDTNGRHADHCPRGIALTALDAIKGSK